MYRLLPAIFYIYFIPAPYAGFNHEAAPSILLPLLVTESWFSPTKNVIGISSMPPASFGIVCPARTRSSSTRQDTVSESGTQTLSRRISTGKSLRIRLERLEIKRDNNGEPVIYCHLCRKHFATGYLTCCRQPACRQCRKNSSGSSCPLCWCSICLQQPEDKTQVTCCEGVFCKSCLKQATLKTTICPLCQKKVCDKPGRPDLSRICQVCGESVPKDQYSGHLVSQHPNSKTHVWDYHFCPECNVYVNPACWREHSRLHGR